MHAATGPKHAGVINAAVYVAKGLLVTAALVFAKIGLEHLPAGDWAEKKTYSFLATLLPQYRSTGHDVVVVDISNIPGGADDGSGHTIPTSRRALIELLRALVEVRVLAVGVDIDLAPTEGAWTAPDDPSFFNECLALNDRVPIRLGVYRTLREEQGLWLKEKNYSILAGGLWLPRTDELRLPVWFQASESATRLPSLSRSISKAVTASEARKPYRGEILMSSGNEILIPTEPGSPDIRAGVELVNYSSISQIERESRQVRSVDSAFIRKNADVFRNKVVLLGDVRGGGESDFFPTPLEVVNKRGVLLHAAAIQTFIRDRLLEFSHTTRLVLDFTISLVILLCVARARHLHPKNSHVKHHQAEWRIVIRAVVFTALIGIGLILFKVVWLDFLLVGFFLLLHPRVESWFAHKFLRHAKIRSQGVV